MNNKSKKKGTVCVHTEGYDIANYKGVSTPIFSATAYEYVDVNKYVYPRYFNTPNTEVTERKLAALENTDKAILFSSGMAATMTSILSFLKSGDHIILQDDIYGGTHDSIRVELARMGIEVSFTKATISSFEAELKPNSRVLFIETPSNPLLNITDIKAIVKMAREHHLVTIIDNTFASPINQNPHDLGIDIVIHSGTKYLGGHSDICCGVATMNSDNASKVREKAIHFGGNLDAQAAYLLERSLKTLQLRVEKQSSNALELARWLENHDNVTRVNYPGLKSHPHHELASSQMSGFGGMLSFDIQGNPDQFVGKLQLIKPVMSLGGVESTICSPVQTSHARMAPKLREELGIFPSLLRLSVGIENIEDLISDLTQALDF